SDVTRENLVVVITMHATPPKIAAFARAEMPRGGVDGFYAGFMNRTDEAAGTVLRDLLNDSNVDIKTAALRLAGLLRRQDVLDAFEKQAGQGADPKVRTA